MDIPGADELSTHRSRKLLTGTVNKCIPWITFDVFHLFYKFSNNRHITLFL
nr:MAG TPA: hypothetical protein [Caudoviricetes sp.]